MQKSEEDKREGFNTRIGPLLKEIFEIQKKIIKETTWDCVKASDYEAGEIVAKKIKESKLL